MVLQLRASLQLHPLHQADQMVRSFIEVGPKMDQKQVAKEMRQMLDVWGVITGTGREGAPVLLEPRTAEEQNPRLLLPVARENLEVDLDDVLGDVTLIAQVEQIIAEGDTYQVIRVLRGGPATSLERGAVDEMLPELVSGLSELGVDIAEDDVFVTGPAIVLRPICAYR
jgi:hypothetical protein